MVPVGTCFTLFLLLFPLKLALGDASESGESESSAQLINQVQQLQKQMHGTLTIFGGATVERFLLLVFDEVLLGYVVHAADLEGDVVAALDRVGHLLDVLLVHLHAVDL